jgi:hypothetical protein
LSSLVALQVEEGKPIQEWRRKQMALAGQKSCSILYYDQDETKELVTQNQMG